MQLSKADTNGADCMKRTLGLVAIYDDARDMKDATFHSMKLRIFITTLMIGE